MQGRGEKLTTTNITQKLHMLLICPQSDVSTAACYRKYDELPKTLEWKESPTEACIFALERGDINEGGRYATNDLFKPAIQLNGEVLTALEEAKAFSPITACMTGSGSCVFALFETKEFCEWAQSRYKGKFRTIVTATVLPQAEKAKKKLRNPFVLSDEEIKN